MQSESAPEPYVHHGDCHGDERPFQRGERADVAAAPARRRRERVAADRHGVAEAEAPQRDAI